MFILVLRYGNTIEKDCINKHIEVLSKQGYCWFGKLGKVPSRKAIDLALDNDGENLVLYSKSGVYKCCFSEVTDIKPSEGYPLYYDRVFGDHKLSPPSIYFKLTKIKSIQPDELYQYYTASTGNVLMYTLLKSMNSVFLATTKVPNNRTEKEKKPRENVNNNICKYIHEGKCNLKSFVNYGYSCEHPSRCAGRK